MPANKNALARYQALDKCFADNGRRYFVKDLIAACNKALWDFDGIEGGVSRRTIYDDIHRMEMDYSAPIESGKVGRNVYYFYETPFSINNQPINKKEARLLKETLGMLSRFKGIPQFDWLEETSARLEIEFQLNDNSEKVVDFENNPFLKGLDYFTDAFNSITNHTVIEFDYKPFNKNIVHFVMHPYYLKQYNNRWFLFGLNDKYKNITTVAIDRIQSNIKKVSKKYIPNKDIDFDEFFDDVVGVTVYDKVRVQKVILHVFGTLIDYIESKPIHCSQRILKRNELFIEVEIDVIPNYELKSLLLSFGDEVEVVFPSDLRELMKLKINSMLKNYQMCENRLHT